MASGESVNPCGNQGGNPCGNACGSRSGNKAGKWTTLAAAVAGGAVLLAGIGCEPPPKPPAPVSAAPGFVLPPSRIAAIKVLGPKAKKFSEDVSQFPGVTGADHRKTLVIALDDLTEILQLINGPDQSPEFTNSLATLAQARATATMQSIPYARLVGSENQALAAIDSALTEMSTRFLLDKDQLPALLETLNAKVTAADASEGSMHDLDATYAFQAADAVVQQINSDLQAMVLETPGQTAPMTPPTPTPPATIPLTPPAVPPTSAPTSAPAATPAP
jgi:hypothetical protein